MTKRNYWAVGANWSGNEDLTQEFIDEKKWVDGYAANDDERNKNILEQINIGDILLMKSSATKGANHDMTFTRLKAIGKIVDKEEYYSFKVEWLNKNLPKDFDGISYRKTIEIMRDDEMLQFAKETIKDTTMETYIQEKVGLLKSSNNLILTGAPGTGKTYLAKQIAESIIKETHLKDALSLLNDAVNRFEKNDSEREKTQELLTKFQQKFPLDKLSDLTLDEYCAGKGDNNNFCWWLERGLRSLGSYSPGSARSYLIYWKKETEEYSIHWYIKKLSEEKPELTTEDLLKKLLSDIQEVLQNQDFVRGHEQIMGTSLMLKMLNSYYPDEFFPVNSKKHIDNILSLFDIDCKGDYSQKNKAIFAFYKEKTKDMDITPFEFMHILYQNFNIAEGEIKLDKTIVTKGEYAFVQFHPSYDYTDFVEGLRPVKKGDILGFELKNGIFKEFCKKAKNNPNKKYVFIIDEINRGEISKIFGELFFSIDPGYRGISGKVKTQFANVQTEETNFADELEEGEFYVPENVYIIGTMNDIDRSVESFDFAMRRRFAWMEITSEKSAENMDLPQKSIEKMKSLNNAISIEGLNTSYHIGAAYFLKLKGDNYQGLWDYHLNSLLFEYLRGMPDAESKLANLKKAYENDGQ